MNKKLTMRVAAFAAFAVGAILPLSAAELAHRWSFNGDYADSVGGSQSSATACGTYVSLYGNRVHTGYGACSHGSGYVDLGTNMLDTTAATIEIWALNDGVKNWSRVFDYGADDSHYFTMSWTSGTDATKDRAAAKNPTEQNVDGTMAPYEICTDYHISVTFEKSGDGTVVKWQRRDAKTGELQKSGTMTMASGIHNIVDPVLYLGHSQYTSDRDAMAAYDEVRVWNGVLTDAQLAASAAAGPDATIAVAAGAPQFTPAAAPEPPAQRAAVPNGGLRLMTYNVQYCYDEVNTIVPDRTAARIIAENPDFCCVNEVRDSADYPEATKLAKLTGMHKSHFGAGSQGNLVLSKEEPIAEPEQYSLPYASGYPRYLGVCEFSNVVVAVAHLDVGADAKDARIESVAQIRTLFSGYASRGKPVFLCGDWNCGPGSDEIAAMKEFMTILSPTNGVRTYHNHKATGGSVIDYIAVDTAHADDLYVARSYVVEDIATSDHNPVIAELYLRPAASDLGWVDESFLTTGRTGTWTPSVAWDGGTWTAELDGEYVFEAAAPSGGNRVTMTVTAAFDAVPNEETTPDATAQGAVWLGTNGLFQVWTRLRQGSGGQAGWLDVAAEGVTPQTGVEYTFRFVFDYRKGTYSADVATTPSSSFVPLCATDGGGAVATQFPLAAPASAVKRVRFSGDGVFRSLFGEWAEKANGFRLTIQ